MKFTFRKEKIPGLVDVFCYRMYLDKRKVSGWAIYPWNDSNHVEYRTFINGKRISSFDNLTAAKKDMVDTYYLHHHKIYDEV